MCEAEELMRGCFTQNRRGGRVKLLSILLPETEFNHKDKVTPPASQVSWHVTVWSSAMLLQP